jgi:tRNA pseudouridine38-40 synthase
VSHPERRIRVDLAYDGTGFAGWQFQPAQRTVQGELERVLSEIQGDGTVSLRGAGRTDSGVHASHQVADCRIRSRLDDAGLAQALRSMLPTDLRPLGLRSVPDSFHSRKDALSKTYRYLLDLSPHGDPFTARYTLHYPHRLDVDLLSEAASRLPGRRDWSGFAAAACDKLDRVRNMTQAEVTRPAADRLCLTFTADGFLQHMVRNLVGTLLEIAGGRMSPGTIEEVLASADRNRAGPTAAPHGLCLRRVHYRGEAPPEDAPSL